MYFSGPLVVARTSEGWLVDRPSTRFGSDIIVPPQSFSPLLLALSVQPSAYEPNNKRFTTANLISLSLRLWSALAEQELDWTTIVLFETKLESQVRY